ncbi:MAG: hypothetical protein N2490_05450 [Ignavibacteria bacterium]|nr:hypothetical protein [Ignavibacteria bacterium]
MMKFRDYIIIILILIFFENSFSQSQNSTNEFISWALFQLVPSPVFFDDRNDSDSQTKFGIRWNIIPVNYSFTANKFVSPFQFFKINPVRRFTGSVELFLQPELVTSVFEYSNLQKYSLSTGSRIILPVFNKGEDVAFSIGGKYTYRKTKKHTTENSFGIESGIYFFGGILGLQYTKNFNSESKYNFGIYFKYY